MFAYINGDFSLMAEILEKVKRDRVNCVVVYPTWPKFWQIMWKDLPVRFQEIIPTQDDLCLAGPRVDPKKLRGRPHFSLAVAVVIF